MKDYFQYFAKCVSDHFNVSTSCVKAVNAGLSTKSILAHGSALDITPRLANVFLHLATFKYCQNSAVQSVPALSHDF